MKYNNFFRLLEISYRIDIDKELRNAITEHFGDDLNIYTEQDLYEQARKIIQIYKEKYYKYEKYL